MIEPLFKSLDNAKLFLGTCSKYVQHYMLHLGMDKPNPSDVVTTLILDVVHYFYQKITSMERRA